MSDFAKDTNVPNNDLIRRQSAINALENTECELLSCEWDELTNAIKQVPPAEPKKGTWVFKRLYKEADECICSECGQLMTTAHGKRMRFCPNCGAKMEEENR